MNIKKKIIHCPQRGCVSTRELKQCISMVTSYIRVQTQKSVKGGSHSNHYHMQECATRVVLQDHKLLQHHKPPTANVIHLYLRLPRVAL